MTPPGVARQLDNRIRARCPADEGRDAARRPASPEELDAVTSKEQRWRDQGVTAGICLP